MKHGPQSLNEVREFISKLDKLLAEKEAKDVKIPPVALIDFSSVEISPQTKSGEISEGP